MLPALTQSLLPALQLTRMALVFTAISNSLCTLLLSIRRAHPDEPVLAHLRWQNAALAALISIGLYGFGMSLNDIIDRRRDRQLAAHRPLPSGRIGIIAAHLICISLALLAIVAATLYSRSATWMTLAVALWTGLLIAFYDFAGKYLVAAGLLTLGLIRFFHAVIPAPEIPLLWHPLFLFTHVSVLSTLSYAWEEKRPPLTPLHWWTVIGGIVMVNAAIVFSFVTNPARQWDLPDLWGITGLTFPLIAAAVFALIAWYIHRSSSTLREAGQRLMLAGLLWLIVYDWAFAVGYVGIAYSFVLLSLMPISYLAVQLMRWWSKLILLSQQPTYRRLPTGREASQQYPPNPH